MNINEMLKRSKRLSQDVDNIINDDRNDTMMVATSVSEAIYSVSMKYYNELNELVKINFSLRETLDKLNKNGIYVYAKDGICKNNAFLGKFFEFNFYGSLEKPSIKIKFLVGSNEKYVKSGSFDFPPLIEDLKEFFCI